MGVLALTGRRGVQPGARLQGSYEATCPAREEGPVCKDRARQWGKYAGNDRRSTWAPLIQGIRVTMDTFPPPREGGRLHLDVLPAALSFEPEPPGTRGMADGQGDEIRMRNLLSHFSAPSKPASVLSQNSPGGQRSPACLCTTCIPEEARTRILRKDHAENSAEHDIHRHLVSIIL